MKGEKLTATVTLTFKQPREGEPAMSDRLVVETWLEETQAVSVWVEDEGSDDEIPIDLESFTVVEVGEWTKGDE